MSVRSTTFGSVRLSGEDADKFEKQVKYGRPKKAARETYARGKKASKEFNEKGSFAIKLAL